MAEVRESLRTKEAYKNVVEDNKVHVEYTTMLEKRVRELESKASEEMAGLHARINELRLRTIQETRLLFGEVGEKDLCLVKAELVEE